MFMDSNEMYDEVDSFLRKKLVDYYGTVQKLDWFAHNSSGQEVYFWLGARFQVSDSSCEMKKVISLCAE